MQMTKFVLCIAAMLGLISFAGTAHAANWLMNGSQMSVTVSGKSVITIRYVTWRSGLNGYVHRGTVCFQGIISDDNEIEGTAYVFHRHCPPTPYSMSGSANENNTEITLYGAAPVMDPNSCRILRYDSTNQNASTLLTNMDMMD
jgi:hypothetical protein